MSRWPRGKVLGVASAQLRLHIEDGDIAEQVDGGYALDRLYTSCNPAVVVQAPRDRLTEEGAAALPPATLRCPLLVHDKPHAVRSMTYQHAQRGRLPIGDTPMLREQKANRQARQVG